jgi:hypothetical protein
MLLSLDPSSTAIGYAVLRSARDVVEFGVIRPDKKSAPGSQRSPLERIDSMMALLDVVLQRVIGLGVDSAVIEIPGRHQRKGRGQKGGSAGGGANLMSYALAVGHARQFCLRYLFNVQSVSSGDWSRTPKELRRLGVLSTFPKYRELHDPGMDASDAIALGVWWFERHAIESMQGARA